MYHSICVRCLIILVLSNTRQVFLNQTNIYKEKIDAAMVAADLS